MLQAFRPQSTRSAVTTSTDAAIVSHQQSVAIIKTLVQVGLGTVTFLRGVFPDEFYDRDKIGPSQIGAESQGNTKGPVVMKLRRGCSESSDQIIDYIDRGILDAVSRGYIRQLLFAIYLDPDKPQDIVECYTFNFTYVNQQASSDAQVQRQLSGLTLRASKTSGATDAAQTELLGEKSKTMGNVKRQVQALIKTISACTESLDQLPRRRFLTFKLYYNETCPRDYEPPGFCKGDNQQDRFHFGTKGEEEVPQAYRLGKVDTGHHGLRLKLSTIAPYVNMEDHKPAPLPADATKNAEEEVEQTREAELNLAKANADKRKLVWDAEKISEDDDLAQEPEPIGLRRQDGLIAPRDLLKNPNSMYPSIGKGQNKENTSSLLITPQGAQPPRILPDAALYDEGACNSDLRLATARSAKYGGRWEGPETESSHRSLPATQQDSQTPRQTPVRQAPTDVIMENTQRNSPGIYEDDTIDESIWQKQQQEKKALHVPTDMDTGDVPTPSVSQAAPQKLKRVTPNDDDVILVSSGRQVEEGADSQMLSFSQTQRFRHVAPLVVGARSATSSLSAVESIGSFSQAPPAVQTDRRSSRRRPAAALEMAEEPPRKRLSVGKGIEGPAPSQAGILGDKKSCECGDPAGDEMMYQCDRCHHWRHAACYGHRSEEPQYFICFRCKMETSVTRDELLFGSKDEVISGALDALRQLCTFRRALLILYTEGPPTNMQKFAKRLEVDNADATRIKKRLTQENYLIFRNPATPMPSGLLESETQASTRSSRNRKKGKGRAPKSKPVASANHDEEQLKLLTDKYFRPGGGEEMSIMQPFALTDRDADGEADSWGKPSQGRSQSAPAEPVPVDENEPTRYVPAFKKMSSQGLGGNFQRASALRRVSSASARPTSRTPSKGAKVSRLAATVEVEGVEWESDEDQA